MTAPSIRLQRGTALLITGPQGCGKTRLARAIAQRHGTFAETSAAVLTDAALLREVMHCVPHTLIIDELRRRSLEAIKAWITDPGALQVRHPYGNGVARLRRPHLIFCSGDIDALRDIGTRRFRVLRLASDGSVQSDTGATR